MARMTRQRTLLLFLVFAILASQFPASTTAVDLPGGTVMGQALQGTTCEAGLSQADLPVPLDGEAPPPDEPLSLWYRRPAGKWVEALPLGNGRLAAMVFGGIVRERLQINENTLWAGGPYDPKQS